ncbi:LOW QUALITY PROTEIN: urease, partial [Streptomyces viridosporus ATCC 14672]
WPPEGSFSAATRSWRAYPRCSATCRSKPPSRTAPSWSPSTSRSREEAGLMVPGEILFADEPVAFNEGFETSTLTVLNTADRPVQVGSHYHFAEANPALDFDRVTARGRRLNIAAGTAVRFEPGIPVDVELVPLAGARVVVGLRGAIGGALDA